jgi:dipeptidyl aminopeptidase/acylaminoacyl peptidase
MNLRIALVAMALVVPATASAQTQGRGLDVRDLVQLERLSSPVLAPDGRSVVYAVRQTDMDANRGLTGLWIQEVRGRVGSARRLTPEGWNVNSPAFAPDGAAVYFLSAKSGSMQLYRVAPAGGEPVQVTSLPLDVGSFRVSPDGRRLALGLEVFPDCADLACTTARLAANEADKVSGVVYDSLFVRHWDTWADGRRNQLYVMELDADGKAAGEPVRLSAPVVGDVPSKPFGDATEYAWAPDSQSIVFSLRAGGSGEAWSTNFDLYRAWVRPRMATVNLTADNPAWDTGPVFSADGNTLYYRAMKRPGFEADRFAIMALDLASGQRREIAPGWDRSADSLLLSADGRRLYVQAQDLGQQPLFAVEIASGRVQRIAEGGTVSGFDVVGNRLAFARDTLASPSQLYVADGNGRGQRALTALNAGRLRDLRMGGYEQFSFAGWNGETVHGYVVRPWNYQPGQRYPVAFLIHGGPQGSFGNNFHYRWNPQTYAGHGFAVVMIDFHGSTGYGQAFTDSISQHWGDRPFEDLQKGWAAALQRYDFLDGERACALGGSYGGYMVNWIAGRWPDGFDCLVSHAGVFDARMMGYNTEELWFSEWENGGTPFAVPQNYEQFNPVNHVAQWRAPLLVIHGQNDYRVLMEQGLAAYSAAQRRGIDSRFLYFPDENHWILKPHNSILWHDTVNAWLERWTRP